MIMGQWVVSVAGIAILAVLCDIILPDGQTRKYIKTVIGVVVTVVMIQPVINLIGGAPPFDGIKSDNYTNMQIQQSYIEMVEEKQFQSKLATVEDVLQARNLDIEIVNADKEAKTISLQSKSSYSVEIKSAVDKIFYTYFDGYKITIKWK